MNTNNKIKTHANSSPVEQASDIKIDSLSVYEQCLINDSELVSLTKELASAKTITVALKNQIGDKVTQICSLLNVEAGNHNSQYVYKAFQLGLLILDLRDKLVVTKKGQRTWTDYKTWKNTINSKYAEDILNREKIDPKSDEYKPRVIRLKASRNRQINKLINIAECGDRILRYAYAGLEGSLEVRFLLVDIFKSTDERYSSGKTKFVMNSDDARKLLDDIEAKHPFPTLDEVKEKDARSEFRLHTDMVGTIYQCVAAGFNESEIDPIAAKAFATSTGISLEKDEAVKLFNDMIDVAPENRRVHLSGLLRSKASKHPAKQKPERLGDHLAQICEWNKQNPLDDKCISKLRNIETIKNNIQESFRIISELHRLIENVPA